TLSIDLHPSWLWPGAGPLSIVASATLRLLFQAQQEQHLFTFIYPAVIESGIHRESVGIGLQKQAVELRRVHLSYGDVLPEEWSIAGYQGSLYGVLGTVVSQVGTTSIHLSDADMSHMTDDMKILEFGECFQGDLRNESCQLFPIKPQFMGSARIKVYSTVTFC